MEATSLVVHQAGEQKIDTLSLKTSTVADLYKESQIAVDSRDKQIAKLNEQLHSYKTTEELMESVTPELHVLFPEINSIVIANGISSTSRYDVYHQKVTLLSRCKKEATRSGCRALNHLAGRALKNTKD